MKTRIHLTALAASATLVLSACGGSGDESEASAPDDAATASATTASVETMFGTVEVPQPEDGELRVVALGWSDAEMALSLGVEPVAVYDWQGFGAENNGVGPWASDLFGSEDPQVIERSDDTVNYEQIEVLDPDLILNVRSAGDQEVYDRLSEIAPTVYGPEGTQPFAVEWDTQLTTVGQALGLADEAASEVEEVQGEIDQTRADNPELEGLSVASVSKFGNEYGAYLPGDGRFDLLADLGLVNNPAIEDLESAGFYASVSNENVPVFDADIAVILPIGLTEEETREDPLLNSLSVVQDNRAIYIDPDSNLSQAFSAASSLSIPVTLEELAPQLSDAASRVP